MNTATISAVVQRYHAPGAALKADDTNVAAHDILRTFAELCRAELKDIR